MGKSVSVDVGGVRPWHRGLRVCGDEGWCLESLRGIYTHPTYLLTYSKSALCSRLFLSSTKKRTSRGTVRFILGKSLLEVLQVPSRPVS